MVINRKVTGRAVGMPAGIAVGVLSALIATIIGALLLGWLTASEKLEVRNIGYGSMFILLLSSSLGALLSAALIKHRIMVVCLACGGSYYLTLLAITALFFGGQYQGMGVTLGVILAGVGSVGLLKAKKKKSITKGYRKLQTG